MNKQTIQAVHLKTILQVLLLTISIASACLLAMKGWTYVWLLAAPVIILQVAALIRSQHKLLKEFDNFTEAVTYRDFTHHFDEKKAPAELKVIRQGFNQINTAFRNISKEKEAQNQYILKILELVNTGILSFEKNDGEVIWMNDTLRNMLQLPHLKKIQALQKRNEQLYNDIMHLQPGMSDVITVKGEQTVLNILLSATSFQTAGKTYKLIAFQDVSDALDENESKAWQKLLSVLTHEIMNSIAPISSLADTLLHRVKESKNDGLKTASTEDLIAGIETIKKRSEGLLQFATTYRTLNTINTPNVKKIAITELFENIYQLMHPTLEQKNIEWEMILKDTDIILEIDLHLIEQVLINLIINAIESVKNKTHPEIIITGYLSAGKKPMIKVSDNGAGISEEIIDKIFIPFFSTKKNGSGIGLSLCKQIMLLHHGQIQVFSKPEEGTSFVLTFDN